MPGIKSLQANEYYAHPRNVFWRLLGDLGLCDPSESYADRTSSLQMAGVALWDVLAACDRDGSLDASIVRESEEANDIASLLQQQPTLRALLFNGNKAEQAFRSHIHASLSPDLRERCTLARLPSTSPAHAIAYARKLDAWRAVLDPLDARSR